MFFFIPVSPVVTNVTAKNIVFVDTGLYTSTLLAIDTILVDTVGK